MLVNMPTSTSIGNTQLSNMEHNTSGVQNSCVDYNYLKRKLDNEDIIMSQQQSQQQQPEIMNENCNTNTDAFPIALWKKRHLGEQQLIASATPANNNFVQILNDHSNHTDNCKNNNNNTSNNNNNISADNNNDLQFNIMSNAFINDLFSYDNNLIAPVAATTTLTDATTVTFTAPSSVTINNVSYVAATDDGNNWQSTDLLELDHRYNSALQPMVDSTAAASSPTIAQVDPTMLVNSHSQQHQQHQQHQQQQQNHQPSHTTQQPTNFLVPQKQVSTRSQLTTLTKYRQHFQLPPQATQQHSHSNHEYSGQSQTQQQQLQAENEPDFEDKNLSWLLNFKFDELPHLSPDIGSTTRLPHNEKTTSSSTTTSTAAAASIPLEAATAKSNSNSPSSSCHSSSSERSRSKSPKTSNKASKKFEELVMEVTAECDGNDMIVGENVIIEDYSPKAQKKPPFTYTELIEYALEDKGELTVSGIYQWISDRFPFYKSNDDRWKNSVRHNLSINPHFRKGAKAPQGAGHLWTISSGDSAENVLAWEHKKQRLDLFFKMESMNRERIQEHQQKMQKQQQLRQQQQQQQQQQHCSSLSALHQSCQPDQCQYDEAAAAAAAITQEMLQQTSKGSSSSGINVATSTTTSSCSSGGTTVRHGFHELPFNDLMSDEELRKTAGQILNGIHRDVEVQSVNSIISTYHDVLLDSDYLNPIHKDVAVNESGLRNTCHAHTNQYYITEIDPIELGIQMSHQVEEEVLFSDEFNLNYFSYNSGSDIVA